MFNICCDFVVGGSDGLCCLILARVGCCVVIAGF